MARNHRNTRKRHNDTRLTYSEISRIMNLSPKQKIIYRRLILKEKRGDL